MKTKQLTELFVSFAKIGVLTFGGGYAMLPMFQRELVEKRGWAKEEELTDYYAISQCTPGPIAVNTATFVGYQVCGVWGGIAATLGVIFPSLVIITVIAALLSHFAEYPLVQNAFAGIRVCVCVLIVNAIVKLWKSAVRDVPTFGIFLVVFLLTVLTDIPAVVYVLAAAAAGIALACRRAGK